MSAHDAKQAWLRGDFNYIRERFQDTLKIHYPMVEGGEALRLSNVVCLHPITDSTRPTGLTSW